MERGSEPIHQSPKTFEQLMADNRGAVEQHSAKALSALLFLGWVLVLLPVLAIPFSHTKADALPAYLPALLIFLILFVLDKLGYMKRFPRVCPRFCVKSKAAGRDLIGGGRQQAPACPPLIAS